MESDPVILIRVIQALTPGILALKIHQGTKFGTLKEAMFSLFNEKKSVYYFEIVASLE